MVVSICLMFASALLVEANGNSYVLDYQKMVRDERHQNYFHVRLILDLEKTEKGNIVLDFQKAFNKTKRTGELTREKRAEKAFTDLKVVAVRDERKRFEKLLIHFKGKTYSSENFIFDDKAWNVSVFIKSMFQKLKFVVFSHLDQDCSKQGIVLTSKKQRFEKKDTGNMVRSHHLIPYKYFCSIGINGKKQYLSTLSDDRIITRPKNDILKKNEDIPKSKTRSVEQAFGVLKNYDPELKMITHQKTVISYTRKEKAYEKKGQGNYFRSVIRFYPRKNQR